MNLCVPAGWIAKKGNRRFNARPWGSGPVFYLASKGRGIGVNTLAHALYRPVAHKSRRVNRRVDCPGHRLLNQEGSAHVPRHSGPPSSFSIASPAWLVRSTPHAIRVVSVPPDPGTSGSPENGFASTAIDRRLSPERAPRAGPDSPANPSCM